MLALAMIFSAGVQAQPLIASETFDDDISGWTATGDPGAQLMWDGDLGSPEPGSLALIAPSGGATEDGFRAVGQCLDARPVQAYTVVAQVREALDSRPKTCLATPVFYDSTDCTGEGSIGGIGDSSSSNGWETKSRSLTSFGTSQSMRIEMVMALEAGDIQATCHFDSVRLYEGRLVEAVPILSVPGLMLLGLAVAFAAWMRGSRPG